MRLARDGREVLLLFLQRLDLVAESLVLRRDARGLLDRVRFAVTRSASNCRVRPLELRGRPVALGPRIVAGRRREPHDPFEHDVLLERVGVQLRDQLRHGQVRVRDLRHLAGHVPEGAVVVHGVDEQQQHKQRREPADFSRQRPSQLKSVSSRFDLCPQP